MEMTLAEILQTTGPLGITLLMGYFWKVERDDHKETKEQLKNINTALEAERDAQKDFLKSLLRKANVIDA